MYPDNNNYNYPPEYGYQPPAYQQPGGVNRTKLLLLAGGLLLLVLAAIGLLLSLKGGSDKVAVTTKQTLYSSDVIGRNIQYPYKANDNTIRFFTGSAIAEYYVDSMHTKAITPEYSLPTALSFVWNKTGTKAIIEFSPFATYNDLYTQIANAATTTNNTNSWWIFDIQTKTFKQLFSAEAPAPSQVVWNKNQTGVYALISGSDDNQRVVSQTIATSQTQQLAAIKNISLLGDSGAGLLLQQQDNLLKFNGGQPQSVAKLGNRKAQLSPDGSYVIYDDGAGIATNKTNGNLYRLDVTTGKKTLLVANTDNTGNYSYTNGLLVMMPTAVNPKNTSAQVITKGFIIAVPNATDAPNVIQATISNDDNTRLGSLGAAWTSGASTQLAIVNSENALFTVNPNQAIRNKTSPYPLIFTDKTDFETDLAFIQYDMVTNRLTINARTENTQDRTKIIQALTAKDSDPNQVVKVWQNLANID